MNKTQKKWTALGLLLIGLILLNFIASLIPGQVDLTEDRLYTLSSGSREILKDLEEPVILNFYFSRSMEGLPVTFKNYATRVQDLLSQYARVGGANLQLNVIDPRPDSDEEQSALRAGLQGAPLSNGDSVYFGLQAIQADQESAIEFFTQEREDFLEFDISKLIYQVQQWDKPVLGVISGLPILGAGMPQMPGMPMNPQASQSWAFISELEQTWEVREVTGDTIAADVDVLAVIHPDATVSNELLFAIDQFILSGKPALLAVDPSSFFLRNQQSQQQMMMGAPPQPSSSNLPQLFQAYGIEFEANRVVGDLESGRLVMLSRGAAPTQYPPLMDLVDFDTSLPPTSTLEEITVVEAGAIALTEDVDHTFTPLLQTTTNSGTVSASMLSFGGMDQVADQLEITPEVYTIAALIQGSFQSAFPDGPVEEVTEAEPDTETETSPTPSDAFLTESKEPATLLILADTDVLTDDFSVRVLNFLGTRALQPLNDNLTFAVNLVDYIGGSDALLSLRGKGRTSRPFTLVQRMELEAQTEFQRELDGLEAKLAEVQDGLREIQQQQGDQQILVASPEILEAIENYEIQEAELRSERRDIRKKLRENIESLELNLALVNLLAMPLLVSALGIQFFAKRNARRKKAISSKQA